MRRRRAAQEEDEPVAHERVARLFPAPAGWVPAAPVPPPPAAAAAELGPGPSVESSWSPRAPTVGESADALPPTDDPAPGLLPETLRAGRLDPGRRGALALLLVCLLAAVVAAGVVLRGRPQEVRAPAVELAGEPLPGVTDGPVPEPTELVVAVAGEVVTPGLVRLPPGSRVDDAVRAAGGLAPGGSYGLLNLARKLVDGEQVLVGVDPPPGAAAAPGGDAAAGGLLDLNAATAADLERLPGIGPVLAERIVDWRTERGRFKSVDQLREVPGIGEAKYAALKSKVTV